MALALIYTVLLLVGLAIVILSELGIRLKLGLVFAILLFAAILYLWASTSAISPFSRGNLSFGFLEGTVQLVIGIVGTILGVASSAFGPNGEMTRKKLWRPILMAPIVMIPTLELILQSKEATLVSFAMLFAISYQNGFFWTKVWEGEK